MKIALIIPYFGKLPNYFQIFLDSCKENPKFDWIIFTDDETKYDFPPNVHIIPMSFSECRNKIQSYFDFQVSLSNPQKLCDYKCAYGYIFKDYLTEYSWWGHCDLDQIFGNLGRFISEDLLNTYDKIGSLGHLTLYRNTPENNQIFKCTNRYREVFSTELGCAFDEWLPGNINEIFLNSGRPVLLENYGADINAYRTSFELVTYNVPKLCYEFDGISNNIFLWQNGTLLRLWNQDGQIQSQEYPYVHLQKRKMKISLNNANYKSFFILPNEFNNSIADVYQLLRISKWRGTINTQWFRVKWKSLKYRIKNKDWNFHSIFTSK